MLKVITCGHSEPCYHLLKRSGGSYYLITLHSKSDILVRVKKIIWSSLYTSSKHFMQALTRSHEFCEKTLSGKCLNFFLCLFVVYSCLGYWLKSIERTAWFWTMEAPGTIKNQKVDEVHQLIQTLGKRKEEKSEMERQSEGRGGMTL